VLAIGEARSAGSARRAAALGSRLDNLYGPTGAAVSTTRHVLDPSDLDRTVVPIGVPEGGSRVYVLDDQLRPVPVGVAGELYVAGAQLARGYYDVPSLSAERFTADLYGPPGARMYRTGDIARWIEHPSGAAGCVLEYRQRRDFQAKAPGRRIELAHRAPTTDTETAVCHEMTALLDCYDNPIGLDDDFFERGGASLLAIRLAARLAVRLGVPLPAMWLFTEPTPAALAARIDGARGGGVSEGRGGA
jgi:hypothetical protein